MQKTTRLHLPVFKKWNGTQRNHWRWISIILLGLLTNTLVNFILDLKYQRPPLSMSLEEYINALIAAWVLLGGTRAISRRLDKNLPWEASAKKRLWVQVSLHLLYIALLLNALLIGITYFFYGGFYNLGDIAIIDISVVALSFLFSAFDSSIAFFANWRKAENTVKPATTSTDKTIEVSLGKAKHLVKVSDICYAHSAEGLVYLQTTNKRLLYAQSLDSLMEQLDGRFFRANRQAILHRDAVSNFSSIDQGKIKVSYGKAQQLTVSRTKAAAFRQWIRQTEIPHQKPERAAISA